MPNKTTTLNLNIEHEEDTKIKDWRSDLDDNFKIIDSSLKNLDDYIDEAISHDQEWLNQVNEVTGKNSDIYIEISKKVSSETGKSLVSNDLIQKLEEDYTKDELYQEFVTKEELAETKITADDINLSNYYTRSEVNGLIVGGSEEALQDYYTKNEIDNMLVGDSDLNAILDYLDAINGYELSMKEFDELNGNGSDE